MKTILIAEDEPAYIKLLTDSLKQWYTILTASDGKRALEIAKTEKPDLILLDIRMPIMDGLTMLRELRKEAVGKGIKVIVLTNLEPNQEIIEQVIKDQPIYYFVKSNTKFDDLIEKVQGLLKND